MCDGHLELLKQKSATANDSHTSKDGKIQLRYCTQFFLFSFEVPTKKMLNRQLVKAPGLFLLRSQAVSGYDKLVCDLSAHLLRCLEPIQFRNKRCSLFKNKCILQCNAGKTNYAPPVVALEIGPLIRER